MATPEFKKWLTEGLEKGYIQEMDKQFRLQYNITEPCTVEQWEDAKKYFSEN